VPPQIGDQTLGLVMRYLGLSFGMGRIKDQRGGKARSANDPALFKNAPSQPLERSGHSIHLTGEIITDAGA